MHFPQTRGNEGSKFEELLSIRFTNYLLLIDIDRILREGYKEERELVLKHLCHFEVFNRLLTGTSNR